MAPSTASYHCCLVCCRASLGKSMKCMRMSSQLACALEPMALRVDVEADLGIALLPSPIRSLLHTTLALLRPWCLPAKTVGMKLVLQAKHRICNGSFKTPDSVCYETKTARQHVRPKNCTLLKNHTDLATQGAEQQMSCRHEHHPSYAVQAAGRPICSYQCPQPKGTAAGTHA